MPITGEQEQIFKNFATALDMGSRQGTQQDVLDATETLVTLLNDFINKQNAKSDVTKKGVPIAFNKGEGITPAAKQSILAGLTYFAESEKYDQIKSNYDRTGWLPGGSRASRVKDGLKEARFSTYIQDNPKALIDLIDNRGKLVEAIAAKYESVKTSPKATVKQPEPKTPPVNPEKDKAATPLPQEQKEPTTEDLIEGVETMLGEFAKAINEHMKAMGPLGMIMGKIEMPDAPDKVFDEKSQKSLQGITRVLRTAVLQMKLDPNDKTDAHWKWTPRVGEEVIKNWPALVNKFAPMPPEELKAKNKELYDQLQKKHEDLKKFGEPDPNDKDKRSALEQFVRALNTLREKKILSDQKLIADVLQGKMGAFATNILVNAKNFFAGQSGILGEIGQMLMPFIENIAGMLGVDLAGPARGAQQSAGNTQRESGAHSKDNKDTKPGNTPGNNNIPDATQKKDGTPGNNEPYVNPRLRNPEPAGPLKTNMEAESEYDLALQNWRNNLAVLDGAPRITETQKERIGPDGKKEKYTDYQISYVDRSIRNEFMEDDRKLKSVREFLNKKKEDLEYAKIQPIPSETPAQTQARIKGYEKDIEFYTGEMKKLEHKIIQADGNKSWYVTVNITEGLAAYNKYHTTAELKAQGKPVPPESEWLTPQESNAKVLFEKAMTQVSLNYGEDMREIGGKYVKPLLAYNNKEKVILGIKTDDVTWRIPRGPIIEKPQWDEKTQRMVGSKLPPGSSMTPATKTNGAAPQGNNNRSNVNDGNYTLSGNFNQQSNNTGGGTKEVWDWKSPLESREDLTRPGRPGRTWGDVKRELDQTADAHRKKMQKMANLNESEKNQYVREARQAGRAENLVERAQKLKKEQEFLLGEEGKKLRESDPEAWDKRYLQLQKDKKSVAQQQATIERQKENRQDKLQDIKEKRKEVGETDYKKSRKERREEKAAQEDKKDDGISSTQMRRNEFSDNKDIMGTGLYTPGTSGPRQNVSLT